MVLFRAVREGNVGNFVQVKNGFATLADKIFVGKFPFTAGTITVVKASRGEWKRCIFPYSPEGKPLPENVFRTLAPDAYAVLVAHKDLLRSERDVHGAETWFLFGRSQALNDVSKKKIAVNTIVRDISDIKLVPVPAGSGVYSGLYILTECDVETVRESLCSEEFLRYLRTLKNYKSGGYYTFSAKDLCLFLNFSLSKKPQRNEQHRIQRDPLELF